MSSLRQEINLYLQLAPPEPKPVTFIVMSVSWGLLVLGYLATTVYLSSDTQALQFKLEAAKLRNQNLQRQVSEHQADDAKISLGPLEGRLSELRLTQQRQQLLTSYLQAPEEKRGQPFSEAMAALARQHVPGISIKKFTLSGAGQQFSLSGQLGHPQALPTYVTNLGREPAFTEMSFEKVKMAMDGEDLSFELNSLSARREVTRGGDS